ncbi:MAG: hypothetical protein ACM3KE_20465 [Hyphomicrobiales bacterium]
MKQAYRLSALLLVGWLAWACDSGSAWEGRYASQPGHDPGGTVTLILQPDGKGQWVAEQESTPLRWEERSGALWLHLKSGAVMVARRIPAEGALTIELPGVGTLLLRKETR